MRCHDMAASGGTLPLLLLLLLAVATLTPTPAEARITHREVRDDARRLIIIEMPFGFGPRGGIALEIKKLAVTGTSGNNVSAVDYSKLGFFAALAVEDSVQLEELQQGCGLDLNLPSHKKLLTFDLGGVQEMLTNRSKVVKVDTKMQPGEYALYFANCPSAAAVAVSFKLRVEMYNINVNNEKDYLPLGETELPTVYLIMFLVFSLLAAVWAYLCWVGKDYVHSIHYLMLVLVVFRALTYLAEAGMYHDLRVNGDPLGWNIAFYVFTFFRGIMFFTVVVLIGTGWSYIRPFIGDKEKKILVIVIPLQVFANIAIVILDETSPVRNSWFEWRDMFHVVDIICCCAILFPIVWSIKHLREGAETDGKAAINVEKLTLFRQFYVMVVVYIYFTRIIVYLLQNTVPFQYRWMSNAAEELATLTFYVLVGMNFRPHDENRYFKIDV